jgi:GAF domain-containing protein
MATTECKIELLMRDPGLNIDENARIAALNRYSILDTLPEQIYDDVTALASLICGTPISLVSLVDADRQWFKAAVGVEIRETPRAQSFCAHTLGTAATLIVRDTLQDPRFMDNPAVVGAPGIRFYAGAPIVEHDGHVLGTVCVIDTEPRSISPIQIAALEALARHTMALMEMRHTIDVISQTAVRATGAGAA